MGSEGRAGTPGTSHASWATHPGRRGAPRRPAPTSTSAAARPTSSSSRAPTDSRGAGTSLGGLEWGSAYDGQRIYTAEADPFGIPYTTPGGQPISGGSWAALDPEQARSTGRPPPLAGTPRWDRSVRPVDWSTAHRSTPAHRTRTCSPSTREPERSSGASPRVIGERGPVNRRRHRLLGHRLRTPRTGPPVHRERQALRVQSQRTLSKPRRAPLTNSGSGAPGADTRVVLDTRGDARELQAHPGLA